MLRITVLCEHILVLRTSVKSSLGLANARAYHLHCSDACSIQTQPVGIFQTLSVALKCCEVGDNCGPEGTLGHK